MSTRPKVYLAAPFFSPEQVSLVTRLEEIIDSSGWSMFSPRKGDNAVEMNRKVQELKRWQDLSNKTDLGKDHPPRPEPPSAELRLKVFDDNWMNIDDADLLLAVIDNFDVGVMWEVGYAFARHVPIVTHTGKNYGCNLMLAHSIVGHTKSLDSVEDVLRLGNPALSLNRKVDEYAGAIAVIQRKYKSEFALKEGPDERSQ